MIRPARFPEDRPAVVSLLETASIGGEPPLSEEPLHDLSGPQPRGLVAESGGRITGYAHLLEWRDDVVAEVAVAAGSREEVLPALVEAAAAHAGDRRVRLWARDDATAAAAREAGFIETRSLLRMECPLPAPEPPPPPSGIEITVFRPGVDEDAYLEVSNRAFSGHPDSAGWDRSRLADRMGRSWFDPEGVFLARRGAEAVGLCWIKIHPGRIGEIYSIAVRPDAGGRGLGKALALHGLRYAAQRRGAERGLLYADAHNRRAVEVYRGIGFEIADRSREFARS